MREEWEAAGHGYRLIAIFTEVCLATVVVLAAYWLLDHVLLGRTCAPVDGTAAQVSIVAWFLWNTHLVGRTGQSWGGKLLGLKVVNQYGEPIGFWKALGRNVLAILISFPCAPGWFWIPWDPKKQAWHDHAFGTYVVRRVIM